LFGIQDQQRVIYHDTHYKKALSSDQIGLDRVDKRIKEMNLKTAVYSWLVTLYGKIPSNFVDEFKKSLVKDNEEVGKFWKKEPEVIASGLEKKLAGLADFMKEDETLKVRVAALFITSYREEYPEFEQILDGLLKFESTNSLWKSRHARMVEKMIGRRAGTGGSSGVDYLDSTSKYRVFGDLWAVRNQSVKSSVLPPMKFQ
jgi:hypothetical protein